MAFNLIKVLDKDRFIPLTLYSCSGINVMMSCNGFLGNEFIKTTEIKENDWIPLSIELHYNIKNVRYVNDTIYFPFSYSNTLYTKVQPAVRNCFFSYGRFYSCSYTVGSHIKEYFIGNGAILNENKTPLLQVLIKLRPYYSAYQDHNVFSIIDSKVEVDNLVLLSKKDSLMNFIKNQLLPAFAQNNYIIEFKDLSKVSYIYKPVIPKKLDTINEEVYSVLETNLSTIQNYCKI